MDKPIGDWLTLWDDGTVGADVDWGGRLSVVERNDECVVVRVEGHTAWNGVGAERKYHSPALLIYAIHGETTGPGQTHLMVKGLAKVSLSRRAK